MIQLVAVTPEIARAVLVHGPLSVPHVPDWPHADSLDALRPVAEHPELAGGTFLIAVDGVVIGDCGWFGPPQDGEVEIGYGVAPSMRGRGYATQAVLLLLGWVQSQQACTVRAEARPGNAASLALLSRLGFTVVEERAGYVVTRLTLPRPSP